MTTLAEMTRYVAEAIPDAALYTGTATGGSATTMIDTNNGEPDEFYNGGTIWLTSGNNIGKYAIITDWDLVTHTATFSTLTLLCAVGDTYVMCNKGYSIDLLKRGVNQALQDIGRRLTTKVGWCGQVGSASTTIITDTNITKFENSFTDDYFNSGILTFLDGDHKGESLTITDYDASDGKFTFAINSYTPSSGDTFLVVPSGVNDIRRIEVDASRNYWWRELANGVIVFDDGKEPYSNTRVTFYHMTPHAVLTAYNSSIDAMIPDDAVKWTAVERVMLARIGRDKSNDEFLYTLLQDVKGKAAQARMSNRMPVLAKDPHLPDY
jgi:hypothetical protein